MELYLYPPICVHDVDSEIFLFYLSFIWGLFKDRAAYEDCIIPNDMIIAKNQLGTMRRAVDIP
jgi:hypothetical protein